jgi:transcriptional regulator GlxA family with amidase domain
MALLRPANGKKMPQGDVPPKSACVHNGWPEVTCLAFGSGGRTARIRRMAAPHNILLLAFPDGQLLDIAGPLQMFAGANDELPRPLYRIAIAAPQAGPFATSSGVRLVADLAFTQVTNKRLQRTDTLITVGGEPGMRQELTHGSVTKIVSRAIGRVPRIASVCSGTFFLAAAGALDGPPACQDCGSEWRPCRKFSRPRGKSLNKYQALRAWP